MDSLQDGAQHYPNMSSHTRMTVISNDQLLYLPDSNEQIHLYLEEFNTWHIFQSEVPAYMISVDKGKGMYKMDKKKEIWEYNSPKSKWINIDSNPDVQSFLASDSQVYQLQSDGAILVYDVPAGRWDVIDCKSQQKRSIAADGYGSLYQLHTNGAVWQYNGPQVKGWTMIDNCSKTNSLIAGAGNVYLMHDDGNVYKFEGGKKVWNRIDKNPKTLQIAVGKAGLFQRQEDKIYKYNGNTGKWTVVLNDRTEDLVVGDSTVYVKHPDGSVSRYRNGPWFKLPPVPRFSG